VSRQHLCPGGSADEYAVPQASPTSGKVLGLRVARMTSGGLPERPLRRPSAVVWKIVAPSNTRNARSDSEVKARKSGSSPAISTKREAC
jgi:hypothetical protein